MNQRNPPIDLIHTLFLEIDQLNLWDRDITLKRNEYLLTEGSVDTNLYYVCAGSLKLSVQQSLDEHILRLVYGSSFVVALDSFITQKPTTYFIQALKKTVIKVLSKARLSDLLINHPDVGSLWNSILQQLLLQQMEREVDLLTASPYERYHRVLSRSPRLFQEIPNKYIASYLRMSPETLSRLKKP